MHIFRIESMKGIFYVVFLYLKLRLRKRAIKDVLISQNK